jgi:alkylation response protein AidB-like acyl-CoA dehydrogenase
MHSARSVRADTDARVNCIYDGTNEIMEEAITWAMGSGGK